MAGATALAPRGDPFGCRAAGAVAYARPAHCWLRARRTGGRGRVGVAPTRRRGRERPGHAMMGGGGYSICTLCPAMGGAGDTRHAAASLCVAARRRTAYAMAPARATVLGGGYGGQQTEEVGGQEWITGAGSMAQRNEGACQRARQRQKRASRGRLWTEVIFTRAPVEGPVLWRATEIETSEAHVAAAVCEWRMGGTIPMMVGCVRD